MSGCLKQPTESCELLFGAVLRTLEGINLVFEEKMNMDKKFIKKYETDAVNHDGLNGYAYVPNGVSVAVSNPLNEKMPGANPEQLLGLSLSTCMGATLQAIEKENNLPHRAQVHVQVTMVKGTAGLEFLVDARVRIPHISHAQAEDFVHQTEKRCPVSKLLSGSENYTIHVVDEFEPTHQGVID